MEKRLKIIYSGQGNTLELMEGVEGLVFLRLSNDKNYWTGTVLSDLITQSEISEADKHYMYTALSLTPPSQEQS
jgi:hypothetical protein